MPLKLELKPGEKIVINGAVIKNSDRRASMLIENQARILRENDILMPEQANTPAKRIYIPVMMMLIDAGAAKSQFAAFSARLSEFTSVVEDIEAMRLCTTIAARVANGEYHQALNGCKRLIAFEDERLRHVA